jgi:hypothetical protein
MKEEDVMRLVKALLEREGASWTEEDGWLRFRLRHGAMLWETACRAVPDALLVYARYPFRPADAAKALRLCGEINSRLVRGAMFPAEDGGIVYRCRAELDDVFGAEERLSETLAYSAQVMAHFWGRLSGL